MKIITLTGSSASGKDLILKEVLKSNERIIPIVSTTTRPMREGEVEGKDYNFVSLEEFQELYSNNELIEFREYSTVEGMWYYGISKNSMDLESDNTYIVILDVAGVARLKNYIYESEHSDNVEICSLYVQCRGQERLIRSLSREGLLNDYQAAEICRRYLADMQEVEVYKNEFDIVLKNETEEDLRRNVEIIGNMVTKKNKNKKCKEI
jgi:guanylate kinase